MKTILIPITSNFFVRSFLRTDSLGMLAAMPGLRLVFLAPRDKCPYYRREFPMPNVIFEELPAAYDRSLVERFYKWIEMASIHSRTVALQQRSERARRGSQTPAALRFLRFAVKRFCWALGRWRWWRQLVRRSYRCLPSRAFGKILDREKPDLVYAPTMLHRDAAILKEASARNIKTAGMVLSWDNLYSKTMLRAHPDRLMAHTASIRAQAVRLGDYPQDRIVMTGVPQYDRHFRREGIMPRERFISSLGGDAQKKLIVYGMSGKMGIDMDFEVIRILAEEMKKRGLRDLVEVLVRPYPRYDLPEERLTEIRRRYGFLATASMTHVGKGKDNWEFDEAALSRLCNTLAHADVVLTMYSTFFIEGAIWEKPLVGIAFDGTTPRDYANSATRFFEWDHLAEVAPLGGIWRVASREEMMEAIETYLENPRLHARGRQSIVAQQCGLLDGRAGERVAEALRDAMFTSVSS